MSFFAEAGRTQCKPVCVQRMKTQCSERLKTERLARDGG